MANKRLLAQAKLSRSGIPPVPASVSRDLRLFLEALRDNVSGNLERASSTTIINQTTGSDDGGDGSGGDVVEFDPALLPLLPLPVQETDKAVVERSGDAYRVATGEIGGGGASNIDGGFSASVYVSGQSVDGGNA